MIRPSDTNQGKIIIHRIFFTLIHGSIFSSFFEIGQESLSVLDLTKDKHFHVKHYRIRRTDQGFYYISSKIVFQTLTDLVDHYRGERYVVFLERQKIITIDSYASL